MLTDMVQCSLHAHTEGLCNAVSDDSSWERSCHDPISIPVMSQLGLAAPEQCPHQPDYTAHACEARLAARKVAEICTPCEVSISPASMCYVQGRQSRFSRNRRIRQRY